MDLNQRLGNYSYSQAKSDFGRPDVAIAENGGKTAEWLLLKPLPPSFELPFADYPGPEPGAYGGLLRLRFDDHGQLRTWNRVEYGLEALSFRTNSPPTFGPAIP